MSPDFPSTAVRELLRSDNRFEQVPSDADYAHTVLDEVVAGECPLVLFAATRGQWAKSNTLSYDAARKSVEALLLTDGWRVRAVPGAHAAVVEVVDRWLATVEQPGPRIAAKFSAARKARHEDEYPDPRSRRRGADELRVLAQDNIRILNLARESAGLEPAPQLVPTEANLAAFLADDSGDP